MPEHCLFVFFGDAGKDFLILVEIIADQPGAVVIPGVNVVIVEADGLVFASALSARLGRGLVVLVLVHHVPGGRRRGGLYLFDRILR